MPGSPPRRMTAPSTSPPPSTRSSSPKPVVKRSSASVGTWCRLCTPRSPAYCPRTSVGPRAAGVWTVSCSVFQAPQSGHWPAHLGLTAPHAVQANTVLTFAMLISVLEPHPLRQLAQQLVGDGAAGGCHLLHRQAGSPEDDRIVHLHVVEATQIDAQHVHRHPA